MNRNSPDPQEPRLLLRAGMFCLDLENRRVVRGEERIDLSRREFEVFALFMREPGRVFSRDELCERIWGREHQYETRTVEISIMRLRKKLDRPGTESVFGTVRGEGYVMKVAAQE